jgi:tRNA-Thr(GGU) m(6)t(6)A37 methyltransferase TsaA
MMTQSFVFTPIGVVRSPFTGAAGTPIQPGGARPVVGEVVVDEAYAEGLSDLDGFSHILLLYVFHRAGPARLAVVPFLDTVPRGVFATRAPSRPNPIGLSLVRLTGRAGCVLAIEGVDMLDGTPVLDIKPYIPSLEPASGVRLGWLEGKADAMAAQRADDRFNGGNDA